MKTRFTPRLSKSSQLCIHLIEIYQVSRLSLDSILLSVFGVTIECKHSPSCSYYAIEQIRTHGTIRGVFLGMERIVTCW